MSVDGGLVSGGDLNPPLERRPNSIGCDLDRHRSRSTGAPPQQLLPWVLVVVWQAATG